MSLEFDEFKGWLGSHLDSEVVGNVRDSKRCPLANFLRFKHNEPFSVGCIIFWKCGDAQHPKALPGWARTFRVKTDLCGKTNSDITAEVAYEILREIRPWKSEYIRAGAA
jgi:hypothetical protein